MTANNHNRPAPFKSPARINHQQKRIRGNGASEGIVVGRAFIIDRGRLSIPHRLIADADVGPEIQRFHHALEAAKRGLEDIKTAMSSSHAREPAFIIDAHIMMLEDDMLVAGAEELVRDNKINAEWALRMKVAELAAVFSDMKDPYLRERGRDVEQVVERVIAELIGQNEINLDQIEGPVVVVAHDITPAETAHMALDKVMGFATDIGSATSHAAIVAKSLRIPAVVGCTNITAQVRHGDTILIDGHAGIVIVDPSPETIEEYESRRKWLADFRLMLRKYRALPSETKDGHPIILAANLEIVEELQFLDESGAEGVGLFRTEYLYLDRDELPSEDEHYESYKKLVEAAHPHGAVIRTLDLGGDKFKSSLTLSDELNPAMGLRAIRLCLARPDLFKTQLRAILRASVHGKTKVMFPMISSYKEFMAARAIFDEVAADLARAGVPYDKGIEVGIMIEVPSAAVVAADLAEVADFFSIGTNDLIQYTLAIDRVNEHVSYLYEPLHPAVLRLIRQTVDAGHAKGIPVHMCGAMAGDPLMLPVLIGLGLDELSMPASMILRVKRVLGDITQAEARALVSEIITYKTSDLIKARLTREIATRWAEAYSFETEAYQDESNLLQT